MQLLSPDTITFGAITVFLLRYVIKSSDKREGWLRKHIETLGDSFKEYVSVLTLMRVELVNRIENIEKMMNSIKGGD